MKNRNVMIMLTSVVLLLSAFTSSELHAAKGPKKPKNIILFIGDGMGVAHVYSAMSISESPLFMEKFPYSGFSKTFSSNNYVTDSGAGGTALACGVKTKNGMIGMNPDSVSVTSIVEICKKNGLATGVVSTSAVTHATPASFVAHNSGRGNYEDLAKDFLNGTVDVFIGGGINHFRKRTDRADLTIELKKQGFKVVYTLDSLNLSKSSKLAGLLAEEHMPPVLEGRQGMLREMTRKAIEVLSRDKDGFFLMVEGSQIDWGAHQRNLLYTVSETLDLDDAIGAAYDFALQNGQTLVIVTADHETGGLSLTGGDLQKRSVNGEFISTSNHTGEMVPVFSLGPGAERFSGIHDNTFFFGEFLKLLNLRK